MSSRKNSRRYLLADGVDAATAGGTSVLTPDLDAPVVAETPVRADLLEGLQVLTELGRDLVRNNVVRLAVDTVLLPVDHPVRDVESAGVLEDTDDALDLLGGELTGTLGEVNLGLLADQVGDTTTNTGDGGEGVDDLLPSINVSVEDTKNVLERGGLHVSALQDERRKTSD
jgi:hypothetical protein